MERNVKYKVVDISCLLLIFILSFIVYYLGIVNTQEVYNSDYAYYAIAGKEIMKGNIFLKGWYGATNTFYLLALIYGVLGIIFGYTIELLYIVSALIWAFFVVVVSLFTLKLNKNKNEIKYIKLLLSLVLCYSSCYFAQKIKILGGVHLDALLLSMFFVWAISVNVEEEKITNRLLLGLFFYYCASKKNYEIRRFISTQQARMNGESSWNTGMSARVKLIKRTLHDSKELKKSCL